MKGTVLLLHGPNSNSNSILSVELARSYVDVGLDTAYINFRGCGGKPNHGFRFYHMGFCNNLIHVLDTVCGAETVDKEEDKNEDGGRIFDGGSNRCT